MYRYAYEQPQNKVSGFLECKIGEQRERERERWSDHSHHDNGHGGNQGGWVNHPRPSNSNPPIWMVRKTYIWKKTHIWQFQNKLYSYRNDREKSKFLDLKQKWIFVSICSDIHGDIQIWNKCKRIKLTFVTRPCFELFFYWETIVISGFDWNYFSRRLVDRGRRKKCGLPQGPWQMHTCTPAFSQVFT